MNMCFVLISLFREMSWFDNSDLRVNVPVNAMQLEIGDNYAYQVL